MQNIILSLKTHCLSILTVFLTFISPIYGLFLIVGIAVILDTTFGIYKTLKLEGYKGIESNKLFNIAVKTFFYMGSMLLGYVVSIYITEGILFGIDFFVPKFLCVLWTSIECKSMDETNIKLGNKSIIEHIKKMIKGFKNFKKDINEIKS